MSYVRSEELRGALAVIEGAEPSPLVPERSAPVAYPVEALGSALSGFVAATVESTRCAEATAAQSGLAVMSLAAQAHADVTTPAGITRPLSLFFVTIAASGERKSAADSYALAPVREVETDEREAYRDDHRAWRNCLDAWEAERTRIKRAPKTDATAKRAALDALGSEPLPPLRPERTTDDTTPEGLLKTWTECHGSRGLFTAEGAKIIAGHGMSPESRLRTAATYSGLWDDGRAERTRAGDGILSLRGRRLAIHLMAQPGVAAIFTGAADLEDQGLTGRFLICEAPEKAGSRLFRPPASLGDSRFAAYRLVVRGLLCRAPDTYDGRNELRPRAIKFSSEARSVWIELHDEIERRLGSAGELGGVKAFGNKLAEHSARMAGILQLAEDPDAELIEASTMFRAATLANFYAAEAERLNSEGRIDRALAEAERLRIWLKGWPDTLVSIPDIERRGPASLRAKVVAERCVSTLRERGHLIPEGPAEVCGVARRETFRIVRGGLIQ